MAKAKSRTRRNSRDFYEVLGVARSATPDEIKSAYRRCAKAFHPDMNKDPGARGRFEECSAAYETLSDPEKRASYDRFGSGGPTGPFFHRGPGGPVKKKPFFKPAPRGEIPAWQPDKKSIRSTIDEAKGYADRNFCLRAIHDESVKRGGDLLLVSFWTFDGEFGRAFFRTYCSEGTLGFGAQVAEAFNASGDYPTTKAVFAAVTGFPGKVLLVRLLGDDVADIYDGLWIEYASKNEYPWNDPVFTRRARILVQLAEERAEQVTAVGLEAARGRHYPSRRIPAPGAALEFFCPRCERRVEITSAGILPDACGFCEFDLRPFRHWPTEFGNVEPGFGRLKRRNRGWSRRGYWR